MTLNLSNLVDDTIVPSKNRNGFFHPYKHGHLVKVKKLLFDDLSIMINSCQYF